MWRNFIEEYQRDPGGNTDRYSYEVRLRVMLHLLRSESVEVDVAELDLLAGLDTFIEAVLVEGEFVWEEDVIGGFPQEVYWYLYGALPQELP